MGRPEAYPTEFDMHVLALVLALTAATEKPHPLAPSLRLLSQAEYDAFDRIIERFVLYDTGKLPAAEGKQALSDFVNLPPEAIFCLIEGLNEAANMPASCPAVIIGKKISQIIVSSTDVQLLDFARENIGAGVTVRRHMVTIRDLQLRCTLRRSAVARLGPTTVATSPNLLLQQLPTASPDIVKRSLSNESSAVRAAAAQTIGQRRLPLGAELIALLEDKNSQAQQAARQALFALSGRDFGPPPTANDSERAVAIQEWRTWWERQGNPK